MTASSFDACGWKTRPPVLSARPARNECARSASAVPGAAVAHELDRVDGDRAGAQHAHHLGGARPARGVVAVGEDHENLAPGVVGHAREVHGDRVVERGVPAALRLEDAPEDPLLVLGRVAGEADVAVEEDEQQVARARDRVEEADGRLLAQPQVLPHALARVEEHAEVERELLALLGPAGGGEDEHLLLPPVLAQDEVLGPQVRDEPAPRVAGGDRDLDDVEPDPEHRRLLGRRQRGGSERRSGSRRRRSSRADDGGDGAQDETGEASGERARHVTASGVGPPSLAQDLHHPDGEVHLVERRHDVDARGRA